MIEEINLSQRLFRRMLAAMEGTMKLAKNFWNDERAVTTADMPSWFAKYALLALILNEIRGVVFAGTIAWQIWG